MILTVKRKVFNKTNTIGTLHIDGIFFCYTLEDVVRGEGEEKVYSKTAIDYGNYKVILSKSNRFKKILPEILNVKGFAGVRIHGGNDESDTEGCLLVAYHTDNKKIWGSASNDLIKKLTDVKSITLNIIK